MEIKGNEFFVLEGKESLWVFSNQEEGTSKIKELMKEDSKAEDLSLMSVELDGNEIKAKVIPWSKIVEGLI